MAEAGTAAEKATSKKKKSVIYQIKIGSSRTDLVRIRGDVVAYFTMGAGATDLGAQYKIVNRKTTGRELFVDLEDTTPVPSKSETTNRFALPKSFAGRGVGRKILVPTEMTTTKGNLRMVTLRFPTSANLAAISNFLAEKCTTHKPGWFLTESLVKRAVVIIPEAEINANEEALTQPG